MLQRIVVQNLAIVPQSLIEFGPGLNVLTGETGSGKSILIEAIALWLAKKLPRKMCERAKRKRSLKALSLSSASPAWNYLKNAGIAFEGMKFHQTNHSGLMEKAKPTSTTRLGLFQA
jgi:DNA repair ATPase RecN